MCIRETGFWMRKEGNLSWFSVQMNADQKLEQKRNSVMVLVLFHLHQGAIKVFNRSMPYNSTEACDCPTSIG